MARCAILLQRHQLLRPECLIMDLARRLNQILQMRASQEIPQRDKFAMVLILDVNYAPTVLSTADLTAVDDNGVLAADDGEGNEVFNVRIQGAFFVVLLFVVVRVHAQVVEGEFFLYALFEGKAFFEGEGVGFGDHGDDVDDVREFFQDDDVNGFEGVTGWLDEEETAVYSCVLNVSLALGGKFFP